MKQSIKSVYALGIVIAFVVCSGCIPKKHVLADSGSRSHLNMGVSYERRGEITHAMQEYARAAQTDPRGNFYLGNLLFQQNRLDEAEAEYRKALAQMRAEPELLNNLAWLLYTKKEKLDEAEELASLAVKFSDSIHFAEYWDTLENIRRLRDEIGSNIL